LSLSVDPENEIFADGMSEEIIGALMQIKKLHVAARTSSFSFKGKHVDLRVIGEQLNVRTVLEGSVRKSGNRLRITAQLVNTMDGYHLWSERYDREMKDVFAIQEEIAKSIAERLQVTLDSERQPLFRAGTDNLEAFKFCTQGRSLFFQRGLRLLPAVEYCKKAVVLDPKYALEWVAGRFEEGLAQAKQAVQMDPLSAYARAIKAFTYIPVDVDGCLETAQETLQIDPDSYLGRWAQLSALNLQGRFAEAAEVGESA